MVLIVHFTFVIVDFFKGWSMRDRCFLNLLARKWWLVGWSFSNLVNWLSIKSVRVHNASSLYTLMSFPPVVVVVSPSGLLGGEKKKLGTLSRVNDNSCLLMS